ncbi:MAG: substrate-binding domain-containing protein [Thermoplasmata archaeon]|nr:substrate-binding domain-containing protein [Thermoplasmata archaeon]
MVATLILILVAVAAAAALYLWLSGWQAGITKGIGSPNAQYSITIGGSTTVYPFDQTIVPWFEQNNSNVVVSDNPGGSGAGILAVCAGQVDIGAASRAITATDIAACPALQNAVQTRIGIAAIVSIVSKTNTVGFTAASAMAQRELASIWQTNGGGNLNLAGIPVAGGSYGLKAGAPSGTATCPNGVGPCYLWSDVATNYGAVNCEGLVVTACTFSASASPIHLWDRADNSGTEANFAGKLLGQGKCGSDQQVQSCGIITSNSGGGSATGNPAVTAAVAADPVGLGFTDIGQIGTSTFALGFENNSQAAPVFATTTTIKLAANGPIAAPYAGAYGGWTPLEYITIGPATGEIQRFIQFAMDPNVNQLATASNGYISVYA